MSRVLLVEPYFSGSHRAWARGLTDHSRHQIRLLTLPGRFWKWRMFGGTLTLARLAADEAADGETPDVILATDMLDLPGFLGHAGPALARARTVLYMHENQLTYPPSPTGREDLAYAYMNWSSMVRADEVWFNSEFHMDSVFEALPSFLRHFPDHRHVGLLGAVAAKSSVVPVGVDLEWATPSPGTRPPMIVWNHRWEYDKDPERFFAALYRLEAKDREFRLALCGESSRNAPEEFLEARDRLAPRLSHFGHAGVEEYRRLLQEASVVVSTAKHEFFGIGAVEAMAAGAHPVFPSDLSYPELVPAHLHDRTLYQDDRHLDALLMQALEGTPDRVIDDLGAGAARFDWREVIGRYDDGLAG